MLHPAPINRTIHRNGYQFYSQITFRDNDYPMVQYRIATPQKGNFEIINLPLNIADQFTTALMAEILKATKRLSLYKENSILKASRNKQT